MTLSELFTLFEAERPKQAGDYAGNMTAAQVQEYCERAELSDEEWMNQNAA